MGKFNTQDNAGRHTQTSSVMTASEPTSTLQGGKGFMKSDKTQLLYLAASFMGGDKNFYESQDARFKRLVDLTTGVAEDGEWILNFVKWVRNDAKMRTAAIVIAVEAVRARLALVPAHPDPARSAFDSTNRDVISAACARADEPGEVLAYYTSRYGKAIPKAIKNGVKDAARELYTERSYLRYGTGSNVAFKFADVIRLTRPKPKADWQSNLFAYITNGTVGDDATLGLSKILARNLLMLVPMNERSDHIVDIMRDDPGRIKAAEFDHMNLPGYLGRKLKTEEWEAIIPNMGVMALLMNLRSISETGVRRELVNYICNKISDPNEISASRVFPMQFYSSYKYGVPDSIVWHSALESGINDALMNIPELSGKTLVMVDCSNSMGAMMGKSKLTYAEAAAIFGSALKLRQNENVKLVKYGTEWEEVKLRKGSSLLPAIKNFKAMNGTNTALALEAMYSGEDRVIIITDEQSDGRVAHRWNPNLSNWIGRQGGWEQFTVDPVGSKLPKHVPMYTWNLAGYGESHAEMGKGNRFLIGSGFSDASFKTIPILEKVHKQGWPWDN